MGDACWFHFKVPTPMNLWMPLHTPLSAWTKWGIIVTWQSSWIHSYNSFEQCLKKWARHLSRQRRALIRCYVGSGIFSFHFSRVAFFCFFGWGCQYTHILLVVLSIYLFIGGFLVFCVDVVVGVCCHYQCNNSD